jgi:hypothetical protein
MLVFDWLEFIQKYQPFPHTGYLVSNKWWYSHSYPRAFIPFGQHQETDTLGEYKVLPFFDWMKTNRK